VVKCNSDGTMNVDELEKRVMEDIDAGNTPCFVNATAGTTVLSAIDDIPEIARICKKYHIWLHVDVSYI
jgi:glutamate/tyrosine decarboxylase-like PLP-dependent enzyme